MIYGSGKICCHSLTTTPLGFGSAGFFIGRDPMIDQLHVRSGSLADIAASNHDVRSYPERVVRQPLSLLELFDKWTLNAGCGMSAQCQ